MVKWQYHNAELNEKFSEARMDDGSVIYITNDVKGGWGIEDYKIEKYGSYRLNHYILKDTSSLAGVHDGKYWKEIKYYDIVVGYYNASVDKHAEYDNILNTIIAQVDNTRRKVNNSTK